MKCERCGTKGLYQSDLCGNEGCVSCVGVEIKNEDVCIDCGTDCSKSGCISDGGMRCWSCYNEYRKGWK